VIKIEKDQKPQISTVRIKQSTKDALDELKIHPRETYDECINKIIEEVKNLMH